MEEFRLFDDFQVRSYRRAYSVEFSSASMFLVKNLKSEDFVVIDRNVLNLFPALIPDWFSESRIIEIEPTEEAKSYESIGRKIDELIDLGVSKGQRIFAIGGGITQDIASFASSILLRGVPWLFLPTNLLTQCDSCIGSKNSVNTRGGKNLVGGFWPPVNICIDFQFLRTITKREVKSGIGEMLHYFFSEPLLRNDLKRQLHTIAEDHNTKEGREALHRLILDSLMVKRPMVELDEFDTGPRNIFNFGHSFGHALEKATDYEVPHGIAVAYGMRVATRISCHLGIADHAFYKVVNDLTQFAVAGEPVPNFSIDEFIAALRKDKKNRGREINVILTEGQGKLIKRPLELTKDIVEIIEYELKDK